MTATVIVKLRGLEYQVPQEAWTYALELFRTERIHSGPYKSNIRRLAREIAARLMPDDTALFASLLLAELGRRGASKRAELARMKKAASRPSSPSSLSSLPLFPEA